MGSVPLPRTFQAGEVETATFMNSLSAVLTFVQNPPRCSVYSGSTGFSCTTGAGQLVTWDSELYDTDSMHSTSSATTRLTAQTPGLYEIKGQYNFGTNGTGQRQVAIFKNGAPQCYESTNALAASQSTLLSLSKDLYLAAGDYVEFQVQQNSGGTIVAPVGQQYGWFQARWVAVS